jgi:hypothetical protein
MSDVSFFSWIHDLVCTCGCKSEFRSNCVNNTFERLPSKCPTQGEHSTRISASQFLTCLCLNVVCVTWWLSPFGPGCVCGGSIGIPRPQSLRGTCYRLDVDSKQEQRFSISQFCPDCWGLAICWVSRVLFLGSKAFDAWSRLLTSVECWCYEYMELRSHFPARLDGMVLNWVQRQLNLA